jgi:hypothetical protein
MEIPPDSAYVLSLMKTTLRLLGVTNRDLERSLKLSGSYMSRLFSGEMGLHFQHILDISRAIGLTPQEMVTLAYPEMLLPPTGEAALRYGSILDETPAGPLDGEEPAPPDPTLVRAVETVVGALLGRIGAA